ncbi:caspase family protein [Mesorhizobium australicum]|uniref:Caspase domain-containing protein n=1 Tax=Mesorhizobium australicum TaxID=536018 RepID=A0A1X7N6W2_9HYPH|nr:caspase family protein [Mesorhizobium australicum]SMH32345.1 Caspase domain-containing protein [Mesorhizobium australicum]
MVLKRAGSLLAAMAFATLCGGTLEAGARTNRALLVGVSEYPNLPKGDWLEGPKNDAGLVRDYLVSNPTAPFAAVDVTVLASNTEGAEAPTRAAILKGLANLAAKAEAGDFVYIQFSGHGSQQPAIEPSTEIDGKDEIFLASDVAKIDPSTKQVPNAILDDEIGAALDAIRDKGAFVWVVFDACHSGTATRAAGLGVEEKERKISPESLGFTPQMMAEARGEATRGAGGDAERENALGLSDEEEGAGGAERGGMVAFFAAQTVETTPEFPQPVTDPSGKIFGLFTYTLMSKLAENPQVTYRQLSQSILQAYSGLNRTKPTPLFEGDLDAPVFGMEPGDAVLQWKVAIKDGVVALPAGMLHRVEPGTKLALLKSPLDPIDDAIGYLEVRSATNLTSQALPAAFAGRSALRMEEIPDGAYARIAEMAINFELAVAKAPDADGLSEDVARANAALEAIAADGKTPLKLSVVEPGAPADIRLAVMRESDVPGAAAEASKEAALWLLPPSGEISLEQGRRPPSMFTSDAEKLGAKLSDDLVVISRAMNLSRLAGASDFRRGDVSVTFSIQRADEEELTPIEAGNVPVLHPGDSIFVSAKNESRKPVDLNVLYVGSDYTISSAEAPIRLHERDELPDTGLFTVSEGSFGNERLIAVLTEAEQQSSTLDLGYLAQKGVRQATRSAAAPEGFAGLLDDIAKAPATRDVKRFQDKRGSKGAVLVFPMETSPAAN